MPAHVTAAHVKVTSSMPVPSQTATLPVSGIPTGLATVAAMSIVSGVVVTASMLTMGAHASPGPSPQRGHDGKYSAGTIVVSSGAGSKRTSAPTIGSCVAGYVAPIVPSGPAKYREPRPSCSGRPETNSSFGAAAVPLPPAASI